MQESRSRPVRSVRTQQSNKRSDLPFPDGEPDNDNPVELLIDALNVGSHTSTQLSRVDDFLVRACFETKWKKPTHRDTEAEKFNANKSLSAAVALGIARAWPKVREGRLETWIAGAEKIWEDVVLPAIERGELNDNLKVEDAKLFSRLLVRYYTIYHPTSSIKLCVVRFPGIPQPQRGVAARDRIQAGTFLLEAGGLVASDNPSKRISGFSFIEHKGGGRRADSGKRMLAGPVRFVNHHCRPNCEYYNVVDRKTSEPSKFYTLRVLRDILPGEEITVNYGKDYFAGSQCLCSHCIPQEYPPAPTTSFSTPSDATRSDLVRATKRARDGKGTYRTPKKLRLDYE
ncbi:Histone-lysine N-methyltransferase set9 [Tulasnella sp. 427]|nr:Histone-lysine N-methyltransferase set9 [Tulasnella sp. 427]